jgi:hypothetical protein
MDNLFRAVIAVPKAVVDEREEQWQRDRKRKATRRASKGY